MSNFIQMFALVTGFRFPEILNFTIFGDENRSRDGAEDR